MGELSTIFSLALSKDLHVKKIQIYIIAKQWENQSTRHDKSMTSICLKKCKNALAGRATSLWGFGE